MPNHDNNGIDRKINEAFKRAADFLYSGLDPGELRSQAKRRFEEAFKRRSRRRSIPARWLAIAACFLVGAVGLWLISLSAPRPQSIDHFLDNPFLEPESANKLLGGSVTGEESNRVAFTLPPVSEESYLAVIRIRGNKVEIINVGEDDDCLKVTPNQSKPGEEKPLIIPFFKSEKYPTYVLFLWIKKRDGSALRKALDGKTMSSFAVEDRSRLLREIVQALGSSQNQLLMCRFGIIDPISQAKGNAP